MVYEPQEDSYLLLEHVKNLAYGRVLDIGTGSGILAQEAASSPRVEQVYAVDIDEHVVKELNKRKIKKIRAYQSDLFANVTDKFDVIIFNPPYLPADKKDKDIALDGGVKGHEIIEMFLQQAKKHLNSGGFILMVFSSRTGKAEVDSSVQRNDYTAELLGKKSLAFFEELYVYKIVVE